MKCEQTRDDAALAFFHGTRDGRSTLRKKHAKWLKRLRKINIEVLNWIFGWGELLVEAEGEESGAGFRRVAFFERSEEVNQSAEWGAKAREPYPDRVTYAVTLAIIAGALPVKSGRALDVRSLNFDTATALHSRYVFDRTATDC